MQNLVISIICLSSLLTHVFCDLYVHNPRGSNNRLTENTATRANGNRLFDSQVRSQLIELF